MFKTNSQNKTLKLKPKELNSDITYRIILMLKRKMCSKCA